MIYCRRLVMLFVGVGVIAVARPVAAGPIIPGATFTTHSGFPWTGNTNYRWALTTNGSNGRFNQPNQGDGSLGNGTLETNLNIGNNAWLNQSNLTLSGQITQLPSGSGAYLQLGVITRAQAERGADWYMSGMFNNAAFMNFNHNSVSLGDIASGHTQVVGGLAGNETVDYEVAFDIAAQEIKGRVSTDGGSSWTSWVTQSFGVDNWSSLGSNLESPIHFGEYAVLANLYNEASPFGTERWAAFGPISTNIVPEPASVAVWSALMGIVAMAYCLRWRRNPSGG